MLPVLLILGMHLLLLSSVQFTLWPEMLLWPYLILKGWLPYKDIIIAHTPVLPVILSGWFSVLGIGVWQLKYFTWLLISVNVFSIWWITSRLFSRRIAVWALILYLPLQIIYDGNGLWFDLALVPVILWLYYFLESGRYLFAGLLWSVALFTKQTAWYFSLPILMYLLRSGPFLHIRKLLIGLTLGGVFFLSVLAAFGILPDFYEWTVKFGIFTLSRSPGQASLPTIRQAIVFFVPFFPLITGLFSGPALLSLWSISGVLGTFPRWGLFHFQPGLPFLALSVAVQLSKRNHWNRSIVLAHFALLLILGVKATSRYWRIPDRFIEPKVIEASKYIRQNTSATDTLFVLHSWDNLYVLSDRLPATKPWVPQFPFIMEIPGIQEGMIADLNSSAPTFVIFSPYSQSGLSSYRPSSVGPYLEKYYSPYHIIGDDLIILRRNP